MGASPLFRGGVPCLSGEGAETVAPLPSNPQQELAALVCMGANEIRLDADDSTAPGDLFANVVATGRSMQSMEAIVLEQGETQ